MGKRYDQCDGTCTVDCGHCKGNGPPRLDDLLMPMWVARKLVFMHEMAKRSRISLMHQNYRGRRR